MTYARCMIKGRIIHKHTCMYTRRATLMGAKDEGMFIGVEPLDKRRTHQ